MIFEKCGLMCSITCVMPLFTRLELARLDKV
jgi:hypothetical protein